MYDDLYMMKISIFGIANPGVRHVLCHVGHSWSTGSECDVPFELVQGLVGVCAYTLKLIASECTCLCYTCKIDWSVVVVKPMFMHHLHACIARCIWRWSCGLGGGRIWSVGCAIPPLLSFQSLWVLGSLVCFQITYFCLRNYIGTNTGSSNQVCETWGHLLQGI